VHYGGAVAPSVTRRPLRERFVERFLRCAAGLFCFGAGIACFVHSDLGVPPWDVFHQGISKLTDLQLGTVIVIAGVGVLLLWIPLRLKPGLGTIMNAVQIGLVVNVMEEVFPDSKMLVARVAYLAAGMLFIAFGSGLYIGAELGHRSRYVRLRTGHRPTGANRHEGPAHAPVAHRSDDGGSAGNLSRTQ